MSNSKQCPECKEWVPLPLRNASRFFQAHIRKEHPAVYAHQQAFKAKLVEGDGTSAWGDAELDSPAVPAFAIDLEPLKTKVLQLEREMALVT